MGRIIVTGGAGFIGCNLALALNEKGRRDLIIVDHLNHPAKDENLQAIACEKYFDKSELFAQIEAGALDDVEAVFHLGACSSTLEKDEAYLASNNTDYTRRLCEWCLAGGRRFIYASSAATYGNGEFGYSDELALVPSLQPLNLYGKSKQAFDLIAIEKGWLDKVVGLKFFNVYGPHEYHKESMRSLVNKAYWQILRGGRISLFKSHRPDYRDGEQVRDFIYVRDVVDVMLHFYAHPERNGLFNCGTGNARSWVDLARGVFAAIGREPQIDFIDMPLSIRNQYQYHTEADLRRLRAVGAYTAPFTPLETAIDDYVKNHLMKQKCEY